MKKAFLFALTISILLSVPVYAAVMRSNFDELRIQEKARGKDTTQDTAVYSTDELHIGLDKETKPNDGYKSGYFDELHINKEAAKKKPVIFPEREGFRIPGFDELHYPEEM